VCYDQWKRGRIRLARTYYSDAWYWGDRFGCGGGRHQIVVQGPTDRAIKEVKVILGVAADSYVSSNYRVRVAVSVDGGVEKEYFTDAVTPIVVSARRFTRMDVVFFAGDTDIVVAIGRVWGFSLS
jgi:hypothetical protein